MLRFVRKSNLLFILCSLLPFSLVATSVYSGELVKVPSVDLAIIDDKKISTLALPGRPVLLTFWVTTCSTCIKEIPHLIRSYYKYHSKGLEVIAVVMPCDPPAQVWHGVG